MSKEEPRGAVRPTVVLGLQFGDEGKGQIVDRLAAEHDVVVRFNGGANAGHSVRVGGERFALHLLPSGVLHPRAVNVIANGVAVEPEALLEEIDGLDARGVSLDGRLLLSDRAHLVLPYHREEDRLRDAVQARRGADGRVLGTTGRGIGPAYADKALRDTALRVADLLDPERLRARLRAVLDWKNLYLALLADRAGETFEALDPDRIADDLAVAGARLSAFVADTGAWLRAALEERRPVLFEGAHAALLDLDHGTYPYVTSSSASALAVGAGCGVRVRGARVVGVAKAYMSRVGTGPFPTELTGAVAEALRSRGREFGTTTGRPRRCGWLDLVLLEHAARTCGVDELVLTGLSVLADLPAPQVGVAYLSDGTRSETVPADAEALGACTPVLEEVAPYAGPLGDVRAYEELPVATRAYVDRVARHTAPVRHVCVGPGRDQVLVTPR